MTPQSPYQSGQINNITVGAPSVATEDTTMTNVNESNQIGLQTSFNLLTENLLVVIPPSACHSELPTKCLFNHINNTVVTRAPYGLIAAPTSAPWSVPLR
eukprot:6737086-Ditylum_brightwellii.AAC.1